MITNKRKNSKIESFTFSTITWSVSLREKKNENKKIKYLVGKNIKTVGQCKKYRIIIRDKKAV